MQEALCFRVYQLEYMHICDSGVAYSPSFLDAEGILENNDKGITRRANHSPIPYHTLLWCILQRKSILILSDQHPCVLGLQEARYRPPNTPCPSLLLAQLSQPSRSAFKRGILLVTSLFILPGNRQQPFHPKAYWQTSSFHLRCVTRIPSLGRVFSYVRQLQPPKNSDHLCSNPRTMIEFLWRKSAVSFFEDVV